VDILRITKSGMIWVRNVIHKALNGRDYFEDLDMDGVYSI
jgi:hypothetical protein